MYPLVRRVLLAAFASLVALPLLPGAYASADLERTGSGQIVAREVRQELAQPAGGASALGAVEDGEGTPSGVIDAGILFGHVGVHWGLREGVDEHAAHLAIRTSLDGSSWSDWLEIEDNHDLADEANRELYANPQYIGVARYAQYRVGGEAGAATAVSLTFIDSDDLNLDPVGRLVEDLKYAWQRATTSPVAQAAIAVPVKTRAQWGAQESLMRWRPEREPWQKSIIHHTVTSNSYSTAASELRSIYYYHAVTRRWGDIGYNFLIDKYGNVWQGRAGGDDVIGGHAYGWNEGTMGVSFLGDFTRIAPTPASLQAAGNLIGSKFAARGIQPFGASRFTHYEQQRSGAWLPVTGESPNIIGHRDASYVAGVKGGQTACPGQLLWDRLDDIRRLAQAAATGVPVAARKAPSIPELGVLWTSFDTPSFAEPSTELSVSIGVRNTGVRTWVPGKFSLSYHLYDDVTGQLLLWDGQRGALTAPVRPGGLATIPLKIRIPGVNTRYRIRYDMVEEGRAWFSDFGAQRATAFVNVGFDYKASYSDPAELTIAPGETATVPLTITNTSAREWPAAVVLGTHLYDGDGDLLKWDGTRTELPEIAPGGSATVAARVTAPSRNGSYRVAFDLVNEGIAWFSTMGVPVASVELEVGKRRASPNARGPATSSSSCPVGEFLAKYYRGTHPSGDPVARRCESRIAYDWTSHAPGLRGVPSDVFAVKWEGTFEFDGGEHEFVARADDGVRVYVDGKRIIDAWWDQAVREYRGKISLTEGRHRVVMEFYENRGLAVASLRWSETQR